MMKGLLLVSFFSFSLVHAMPNPSPSSKEQARPAKAVSVVRKAIQWKSSRIQVKPGQTTRDIYGDQGPFQGKTYVAQQSQTLTPW